MGDRIAIMEQGVLQQVGPPQEVYDRPANVFVAGFIGSPAMNMFPARLETRDGELFALSEVASFRLSPQQADGAREASDGEILVGVRPEHLYVGGGEGSSAVSATLGAMADLVEYLGSEAHITFSIGNTALVARLDARVRITPGETVSLNVPIENLHLFDRVSGRRLV